MSHKSNENHILIEYHDINYMKTMTYTEFENAKHKLTNLLSKLLTTENNRNLSQCIAIHSDIELYCVPVLIAGIIETNKFSFTLKTKGVSCDINSKLTINLVFSHNILPNYESVFQFSIMDKIVYLLKHKDLNVKERNSVQFLNMSTLKFYFAITTSGTTGVPKIVRVTDHCINSNISDFSRVLKITPFDKITQLTPLTFDPSIIEIFLSIKNHCTLFIVSNQIKNNQQLLLDTMINSKVTIFQTTPSLLLNRWSKENLKKHLLGKNSTLKALLLGGEPFLKPNILSMIKEKENTTRLFNVYGITEVSCWSSLNEIVSDNFSDELNYLGNPLSDTIFEVRNSEDKVVTDGEGVLYIGSENRLCQIDDEENITNNLPLFRITNDIVKIKFNKVYYIGRSDDTIKRFGNKVNLSKLENYIERSDEVAKCSAIWDEVKNKLHLFVKPSSALYDIMNFKSDIRRFLKGIDESYQPDEIHYLKSFPLTEHGKICKLSLKRILVERTKPLENLTDIVKHVWEGCFGNYNEEGFLDLGGNSMIALQITSELSDLTKIDLSGLTTILLNNANYANSLAFILKECNRERTENANLQLDEKESILQNTSFTLNKKLSQNTDLICLWQKSRGDNYDYRELKMQIKDIIKDNSYDLKKCVDASPTIFKYSNGITYVSVGSHSGIIVTVSLNNSNLMECYQIKMPDRIEASILALDNFLGVVGCYDGCVYCVELNTGDIAWKFQTGGMVKCTALKYNDCLFIGSYDTYMYCLSTKNGQLIWKTKVSSGSITAKPRLSCNQKLLLTASLDGTCAALDVTSGEIKWCKKLNHPIFSSPAVLKSGHVIFCTVIGNIICFDINRDIELWTHALKLNIFSYPVVQYDLQTGRDKICIVAHDTFFQLECDKENVHSPKICYKIKLPNTTFCTPWCERDIIVLADSGGVVRILNFQDGIELAEIKLNGEIFSSPVLCDDNIVVGCRDNCLHLLKLV